MINCGQNLEAWAHDKHGAANLVTVVGFVNFSSLSFMGNVFLEMKLNVKWIDNYD